MGWFSDIIKPAATAIGGAFGGPAGAIGGALVGGILSNQGAKKANSANKAMAREQMGFQERMSNTAYQRAVSDMRAANINPVLAAFSGGASTPTGSSAVFQNELSSMSDTINSASNAVDTLTRRNNSRQQIKVQQQEILNMRAQNKLTAAQTADALKDAAYKQSLIDYNDMLRKKAEVEMITTAAQLPYLNTQADFYNSDLGKVYFGAEKVAGLIGTVLNGANTAGAFKRDITDIYRHYGNGGMHESRVFRPNHQLNKNSYRPPAWNNRLKI